MTESANRDDQVKHAIEALLFVSYDPVSAVVLSEIVGVTPGDVSEALGELQVDYAEADRGIQLREVAGGWRFYTHPAYHDLVETFVRTWDTRTLSQAAIETLAVVAYHQPVTRDGVRGVRGVNSDGVISSLVEKGLIREVGREKTLGQAILYGTTPVFLERFGLKSIEEMPPLEDFAPDEESRRFIRERLTGTAHARALFEREEDADEDDEDEDIIFIGDEETSHDD